MKPARQLIALVAIALLFSTSAFSQSKEKTEKPDKAEKAATIGHLRIEVTGGEKNQPVEGASVYVKYVQERAIAKDKKIEMNLKTTPEGAVRVPEIPRGKILIQVIAQGWKPFGRWYNIEEDTQTIKIHLEKPPRWY